ncbi:CoA-transferase [Granulicoccus phenolivorans]|uniref:CoA-transferase n=1 Tax=Granulicoccus phenolivorans TaxID=266854 RepID=UPI0009DB9E18|nr:CoA-transferase [Granulicoccus phenolivorans]
MDKTAKNAAEAVADIPAGASLAVGGFGVCGIPSVLIDALLAQGADDLEVISNNAGIDGVGLGTLLEARRLCAPGWGRVSPRLSRASCRWGRSGSGRSFRSS